MAVAYDATGAGGFAATGTTTTATWTHTLAATATDIVVVVGCETDSATATAKVGSTAMTSLGKVHNDNASSGFTQVFGLSSPPTGSQTITITRSAGNSNDAFVGNSMSFTGSNGYGTVATNFGNSNSDSVTINPTTSGNMAVGGYSYGTVGGESTSTGTLEFHTASSFGDAAAIACAGITQASTGSSMTLTLSVTTADFWGAVGFEVLAAAAAGGVNYVTPRILPEPTQLYHWWQQRTALIDQSTAANPLVSPLDTAWQADGYYSHLYNEPNDQMRSLANDRVWWPQQKILVSDPNLLTTALLDPPLVIGRNKEPWRRDPYWTPPGPPGKDPNELATALLEDVLLFDGGADGPSWHRKNDWRRDPYWTPPQREPGWDPNLLVPPGQGDPTQSGYLPQPYWVWRRDPYRCDQKDLRDANTVGTPANPLPSPLDVTWQAGGVYWHLYNDWRRDPYWTPPQREPGWDPNELVGPTNFDPTLAGLLAQAYWVWRRDPYWTPPQREPGWDPNELATALLEGPLLGIHPKDLWRRDPYWVPPGPPGKDPLVFDPTQGGYLGQPYWTWRRDPYWTPPGEPGKDPNLLVPPTPFDPTQGGYLTQPYWVWRRDPYWTQLLRWFGPPALNPNGVPSGLAALVSPALLAALIAPTGKAALVAPTEKGGKA